MIEHIVNPFELLCECSMSLPDDGILYLETPRLDWILEHKAFLILAMSIVHIFQIVSC